jgi:basic amino acid/polyamine antiporter, APA family
VKTSIIGIEKIIGIDKRGVVILSDQEFGLIRVLGLPQTVAVAAGMTIGAGIFVLTGIAAGYTGPAVPLAYLVSVIPVIFLMMSLAMLGSALPTTGGNYKYASRLFSPRWAFIGIWGYMGGTLVGAFPLWALSGAHYLQAIWDLPAVPVAVGILTILFLINLFGVSMAAALQAFFVLLLFGALLVFGIFGLGEVNIANFTPLFPAGTYGFILATSILTFTHLGANAVVELGGEIKNPGKNIPISFLIAIPLVTLVYFLVSIPAVGILPNTSDGGNSLALVAKSFMSPAGFYYFILGGGLLAIVTTLNAGFMWGTKSLLVMASDGIFPAFLAVVSKRFRTPHRFLIFIYFVSTASVIIFGESYLEAFAALGSIGGMIIFIPILGAALRLPGRAPQAYANAYFSLKGVWLPVAVVIGAVLAFLVMVMLLIDLWAMPDGSFFSYLFITWLLIGYLYYEIRRRLLLLKGVDLQLLTVMREEDF